VDDQLKRFAIICGLVLVVSLCLLLPAKWATPTRPANVPSTAMFASNGKDRAYWIDCWNLAGGNRYSCTLYQAKGGETVLKGVFQQTSFTQQKRIFYDGSAIHWRQGQLLSPVRLECVAGGKPPLVRDCQTAGPGQTINSTQHSAFSTQP
jgi:hypothetical protein